MCGLLCWLLLNERSDFLLCVPRRLVHIPYRPIELRDVCNWDKIGRDVSVDFLRGLRRRDVLSWRGEYV